MGCQWTFPSYLVIISTFFLANQKSQVLGAAVLPSFSDSVTIRLNNNNDSEFPQIFLENVPNGRQPDPFDEDDSDKNSLITCKGTNLRKLRVIHCNDFPDCQLKIDCLQNRSITNQTCPPRIKNGRRYVKIGTPCNDSAAPDSMNCLHLNLTTSFGSGLIECMGHDPGHNSVTRTIDYFARGPNFIYKDTYLLGESVFRRLEDRQLLTDKTRSARLGVVAKKGSSLVHEGGSIYPNERVFIYCHVNRVYFDSSTVQIFRKNANGEKVAFGSADVRIDKLDPVPFYDIMRTNWTVSANDSGFTCSAKLLNSTERVEAIFNFKQGGPAPPVIDRSHDGGPNKTFHRGDTYKKLACFARGDPQPSIAFYRDGRKIFPDGLQIRLDFEDEMRRTLTLKGADGSLTIDESVAGVWTCRAENLHGNDSFNITVTVV